MKNGTKVATRLRKAEGGGIPWMTILDGDGIELVTSDSPDGNVGCPISEAECAWFVAMIEKTALIAPQETAASVAEALAKHAASRR